MILAFNLGDIVISILACIFALWLIIIIHEGGHFFFARRANILCREFAFGMGPLLWKKKKGETLYSIRALPIGGFCAIAGEEVEEDPLKELKKIKLVIENGIVKKLILDDKNNLFDELPELDIVEYDLYDANDTGKLYIKVIENDIEVEYPVDSQALYVFIKPVRNKQLSKEKQQEVYAQEFQIAPHNRTLGAKNKRQRAMVMFGGPMMNFVLAIVMFFFASLFLGFSDTSSTKLGEVSSDTPAYIAGCNIHSASLRQKLNIYAGNGFCTYNRILHVTFKIFPLLGIADKKLYRLTTFHAEHRVDRVYLFIIKVSTNDCTALCLFRKSSRA